MTNSHSLAILAGGGALPGTLANAALEKGMAVHIVTFKNQPKPAILPAIASNAEFPLGQAGHILAHLKKIGVTHIAFAGNLDKPSILSLKPDALGIKLLARAVVKHDDALLRMVTDFLSEEGFQFLSVKDLVPSLLAPAGTLTKAKPKADVLNDLAIARTALGVLGDLDIGQALVVHNGAILGVEGAEGTDGLIARCAALRTENKGAVLVKRAKLMQTDLADLPTVGLKTIQTLAELKFEGLAIEAGRTILLNQAEVIAHANAHGLLIQSDA